MTKRILFDLFVLLSIFILPWWVSVLMVFVGIFVFDNFYEFILTAIIIYSLYNNGNISSLSPVIFLGIIVIIFFIFEFIRSRTVFYDSKK